MDQPVYELQSLEHAYGGQTVLSIAHLTVQPASIVGLIGPNGGGKSTLLKLMGLIERPTQGRIIFNGRPVEPFSDDARFQVSMLPQEPFLMKRSVFNNVSYGLKLRGAKNITTKVYEALSLVGLDGREFSGRPWYALSGGEAQRVALAARLVLKPKALLLDEPTASVDVASAQLIKQASLWARQELGTTLIVASHDWPWLYEVCDKILHLYNGRIFGTGREAIIFGPWEKLGTNRWGKILSDGQHLRVPPPPGRAAAAVIDLTSVGDNGRITAQEDVVLNGVVSRLSLEKKTGQIFATILVGDLSFSIKLPHQQNKLPSLFPGRTVRFRYRLDQVRWI